MNDNNTAIIDSLDPEIRVRLSRRDAMQTAFGRVATVATVPVLLAAVAGEAFGRSAELPAAIRNVLNFALTLEYLEDGFYQTGLSKDNLIPAQAHALFETIGKHEAEHVALLESVLGSETVKKPEFDFTAKGTFEDVFSNYKTFLALSQAFEDTGVRAYKGQAGFLLGHAEVLTTALQIHSVEARHAAHIRRLRGQPEWIISNSRGDLPEATQPIYNGEAEFEQGGANLRTLAKDSPVELSLDDISGAFDEPLTKEKVLEIVKPFIKA